jgi:hypothetical protein
LKPRTVSTTYAWLALILIATAIIAVAGWANLQLVNQLPLESEFQAKWEVTRDFIFYGSNLYNNSGGEPFTSPLPVVLFYSPFALIENYQLARVAWITVSQVATVVLAILCLQVTYWQINRWLAAFIVIFALLWFPAVSIYIRGNETALIAVLFITALFAIQQQNDEVAGVLLGLAALQPRVTFLIVLLVLLWAGSHRRWLLHLWAAITFLVSSSIGLIFLPGWPLDFFWTVLRNVDFSPGKAIIETTTRWWPGVGLQIGWGIFILAFIILIIEWWLVWRKDPKRLVWVLSLSMIITTWIGFETNSDHLFMLLLPLITIFMSWNRRWGRSGQVFVILMTSLLLPGLWWGYVIFQEQGISGDVNPILMIGFPLLSLFGLYWVRWWFIRPTYLDER